MKPTTTARVSTGVSGLDEVFNGGLPPGRLYLVEGDPGAGKTTLGAAVPARGRRARRAGLYVTLSETSEELRAVAALARLVARRHRDRRAASRPRRALSWTRRTRIFHPSEVELQRDDQGASSTQVERASSRTRVVFDSLSEMRLLAQNPLRYRRQILALKQYFAGRQCTVLLLDDRTGADGDLQLQSIAPRRHRARAAAAGLRRRAPAAARREAARRRVPRRLPRLRDRSAAGSSVFPRLVAAEHRDRRSRARPSRAASRSSTRCSAAASSAARARCCSAPPASGKSTLAAQYAVAAARRGEQRGGLHASTRRLDDAARARASARHGHRPRAHRRGGIDRCSRSIPAELSPGEFAHAVRDARRGPRRARVVVIDSLNGYLNAMPEERFLGVQLHELLDVPRPAGRRHASWSWRSTGWSAPHADADRRQLPRRHGRAAALLRGARRGAQGDLGGEEAHAARTSDTIRELHHRRNGGIQVGRAARRVPAACSPACPRLPRASEPLRAGMATERRDAGRERVLVLAPTRPRRAR